ncbi:MAG TPA: class I SAM-dependent methyltransferase [Allosphingosinicella sp.]|jgi:type II protein arginine methyltransferase
MSGNSKKAALPETVVEAMVRQAGKDGRKLAALAGAVLTAGDGERAYALAMEARRHAPDDAEVASVTARALSSQVPKWHFRIVRDAVRNAAWEAAIVRAVGPTTRVLDIGAGTGLLGLIAARAGAGAVVGCEMNRAVAEAAAEIVALNGYADRVRIVPKASGDLTEEELGGRVDLIVSEIVSNDMLAEGVLPTMEDVVPRLLAPGGRIIPSHGQVRVALADWTGLEEARLSDVSGFDMSPFNRLEPSPHALKVGDPRLSLRSEAADLFNFDFASGGPYPPGRATVDLSAQGGRINGVVQWIRLQLDEEGEYENRPGEGAVSCWAARFHPLIRPVEPEAGTVLRVRGAHDRDRVRLWVELA